MNWSMSALSNETGYFERAAKFVKLSLKPVDLEIFRHFSNVNFAAKIVMPGTKIVLFCPKMCHSIHCLP